MKKAFRVALWLTGGLVLLLALVLGLALTPAVQTRIARSFTQGFDPLRVELGRVAAGPSHTVLTDIHVTQPGIDLVVPRVEIDVGVLPAALKSQVKVTRLVAKDWRLELSESGAAQPVSPQQKAAQVFRGIFEQLKLPVDLSVEGVEIAGDVVLPAARPGAKPDTAHVTITGGGLKAGADGQWQVVVDGRIAEPDSPVDRVQVSTTVTARLGTDRAFEHFAASTRVDASGQKLPEGARLDAVVSATRHAGGESYAATLEAKDAGVSRQLVAAKAEFTAGSPRISGTWNLDVRDRDVSAFTLGRALPSFNFMGDGAFELAADFSESHAQGKLRAEVARLEVVQPQFASLGRLKLDSSFDVALRVPTPGAAPTLRVQRLNAEISGARPVGAAQALQPFEFDLATGSLRVADASAELLRIDLSGVPLAWAQPWIAGLTLSGDDVTGAFVASARDGGLSLRAAQPLAMHKLTITDADGGPMLRGLDVDASMSADYTPAGWQGSIDPIKGSMDGGVLFSASARAGRRVVAAAGGSPELQPMVAQSSWDVDLAALARLPAYAGKLSIKAGRAHGELSASLDAKQVLTSRTVLSGLQATDGSRLPDVTVESKVERGADGALQFQLPTSVATTGTASDFVVEGRIVPGPTTTTIDAKMRSAYLAFPQLQAFAALAAPPAQATTPAATPATSRTPGVTRVTASTSNQAIWAGLAGTVALDLADVNYAADAHVKGVAGTLRIEPTKLSLVGMQATLDTKGAFRAEGAVTFQPGVATPYGMVAAFSLSEFDTGAAFRAVAPASPALLDAKVDLKGDLRGSAVDLASLGAATQGEFSFSAKGGTLRVLSVDLANKLQPYLQAGGLIGGLIGGGNKIVDRARSIQEVARDLGEIRFDQFSLVAARDSASSYALRDLSVIAPNVRLSGSGKLSVVEGKSIYDMPLAMSLTLGVRGSLADKMRSADLLGEGADNLGYSPFYAPITLDGTLRRVGVERFGELLMRVVLNLANPGGGNGGIRGLLPGFLGGEEKKSETPPANATPTTTAPPTTPSTSGTGKP